MAVSTFKIIYRKTQNMYKQYPLPFICFYSNTIFSYFSGCRILCDVSAWFAKCMSCKILDVKIVCPAVAYIHIFGLN